MRYVHTFLIFCNRCSLRMFSCVVPNHTVGYLISHLNLSKRAADKDGYLPRKEMVITLNFPTLRSEA